MNKPVSITRTIVIVAGIIQLILGMLFWADIGKGLIPVHATIGTIFVLSLLALVFQTSRAGAPRVLVIVTSLWAVILLGFGFSQTHLLAGSMHWIIQVIHLLLGVAAMGFASVLAGKAIPGTAKEAAWDTPDTASR